MILGDESPGKGDEVEVRKSLALGGVVLLFVRPLAFANELSSPWEPVLKSWPPRLKHDAQMLANSSPEVWSGLSYGVRETLSANLKILIGMLELSLTQLQLYDSTASLRRSGISEDKVQAAKEMLEGGIAKMRASLSQTEGDLKALKSALQAQATHSTRSVLPVHEDMAQTVTLLQSFETTLERSLVSLQ